MRHRIDDGLVGIRAFDQRTFVPTKHMDHLVDVFTLRNTCVLYSNTWVGQINKPHRYGVRADFISEPGATMPSAIIHGFNEFQHGFRQISSLRPATKRERAQMQHAIRHPLGLVVQAASLNAFHQLYHAVAAFDALRLRELASGSAKFVPLPGLFVAQALQPDDFPTAACAISPNAHMCVAGYLKRSASRPSARPWMTLAWQITRLPFGPVSTLALAHHTAELVAAGLTCFDRLEFALGGISPSSVTPRARAAAQAWRCAMLRSAAALRRPSLSPMAMLNTSRVAGRLLLYVVRSGPRAITNDEALSRALYSLPGTLLMRVRMEDYSLAEQLELATSSSLVLGVHGTALLFSLFLGTSYGPGALVEVQPPHLRAPHASFVSWRSIFKDMVLPLGIHYVRHVAEVNADGFTASCGQNLSTIEAANARGCLCSPLRPLACNVTVNVTTLMASTQGALAWIASFSSAAPSARSARC